MAKKNNKTKGKKKAPRTDAEAAKRIAEMVRGWYSTYTPDGGDKIGFDDGTKVKLNVAQITGRKDYPSMQLKYRAFVESNADTIFTIKNEKKSRVVTGFAEHPDSWLFWYGDLIKVDDVQ